MNVAAGNFNQQKNDLAAAVSNGQYSTAGSAASQTSTGNTTVNSANYAYGGTYVSLKLNADGSYKGHLRPDRRRHLDTWEGQTHPGGSNTGHIDVDSQAQGAKDLNHDGGAFAFKEKGDVDLKGTVSGFIPAIVGFKTPVTNNASLSNSLQNVSGNVGEHRRRWRQPAEQLPVHRRRLQQLPGRWRALASDPGPGFRRQPEPFFHPTQEPAMRTLILSLLLLVDLTAQAATLGFPAPARRRPGHKQVQSIRERRFADLVEQKTDFSRRRGPSRPSWRRPTAPRSDEQAVIQGMLAHADPEIVRTQGFSMLDMKRYVESMGMRARLPHRRRRNWNN